MDKLTEFHNVIQKMLQRIQDSQLDTIKELAHLIADKTINGGVLYGFGTGHSHVIAEELYIRAGGAFYCQRYIGT